MGRKLEVGDVLGEVFAIYRAHAGVLLPVAFWLFLVVAIVNGLSEDSLALAPVVLIVSVIAGTLYQGMVVNLVRDVQDGTLDASMGELVRSAMPFLLPLIGAGIVTGVCIAVGLVLLIVPGLFLLTIWAVVAPAIVIEGKGVFESLGRSRQLVRGNGWPVFGALICAYLIAIIGGLILTSIAVSIADGPLLRIVFSAIASTVTAPIGALVAAVLYYRLRGFESAATPEPPEPADPALP